MNGYFTVLKKSLQSDHNKNAKDFSFQSKEIFTVIFEVL